MNIPSLKKTSKIPKPAISLHEEKSNNFMGEDDGTPLPV